MTKIPLLWEREAGFFYKNEKITLQRVYNLKMCVLYLYEIVYCGILQ